MGLVNESAPLPPFKPDDRTIASTLSPLRIRTTWAPLAEWGHVGEASGRDQAIAQTQVSVPTSLQHRDVFWLVLADRVHEHKDLAVRRTSAALDRGPVGMANEPGAAGRGFVRPVRQR
jgi:hypothetical protein